MHRFTPLYLLVFIFSNAHLHGREAIEAPTPIGQPTHHASKAVEPASPTPHRSTPAGTVSIYKPHQQIVVNTKIPGKMRGLKTAVSGDRKQRYVTILTKSQTIWNHGDDRAYVQFWNTLTTDKKKLVKSHAKNFQKGTPYLAFINKLPLKGEAMLVRKDAIQSDHRQTAAIAGASTHPIDSGQHGSNSSNNFAISAQSALCQEWALETNKAERIKEIRRADPAKFQALKQCH